MLLTLPYPEIDPVLVEIGPIAIRWYALAYIAGFLLGYQYCLHVARQIPRAWSRYPSSADFGDFLTWAVLGTILGGRLGYVLFYAPGYYLDNPLAALQVWEGGMAFHGGMLGVALAIVLFARARGLAPLALGDLVAGAAPIGLFFGRLANFVNNELWGRPSDLPWAMVFPIPDHLEAQLPEVPRHPSQLYEALLEGVVLFLLLLILLRWPGVQARPGLLTGVFLLGYGVARFLVEFVRQYDLHIGLIAETFTMGQILSLPMILGGAALAAWAGRRPPVTAPGSVGR